MSNIKKLIMPLSLVALIITHIACNLPFLVRGLEILNPSEEGVIVPWIDLLPDLYSVVGILMALVPCVLLLASILTDKHGLFLASLAALAVPNLWNSIKYFCITPNGMEYVQQLDVAGIVFELAFPMLLTVAFVLAAILSWRGPSKIGILIASGLSLLLAVHSVGLIILDLPTLSANVLSLVAAIVSVLGTMLLHATLILIGFNND